MKKKKEEERSSESNESSYLPGSDQIQIDTRRVSKVGIWSGVIVLIGAVLVGEASGFDAKVLLETSLETTRSFCGNAILALGNILALMLTLLSLSASTDIDLKWTHYQRVKQVALFDTVILIGAILLYLLLNVPLEESDGESGLGFATFYYITLVISSILGGALIAVVVMLYNTIKDVIGILGHKDSSYVVDDDEEGKG